MIDTSLLENIIVGRVEPHIYAFTTNTIPNYLKVGDTYRPVSVRLKEWRQHYPELKQQYEDKAKVAENVYFRDYSVHHFLEMEKHKTRLLPHDLSGDTHYSNEFFRDASAADVKEAISDIVSDYKNKTNKYQFYNAENRLAETFTFERTETYEPRPNQKDTIAAFKKAVDSGRTNLLMYAVMRFGKSFTSMCCAVEMNANFVVIVSAKADVMLEWKKTVESHVKFSNYDFITSDDLSHNNSIITDKLNDNKKVVVFLTLQDLQGDTIKDKHQQVFGRQIDLLIVDETHFGARAAKYGAVLRGDKDVKEKGEKEESYTLDDVNKAVKTAFNTRIKLHLSGTPYRILMGNEFSKEDIIAFYQFTDIVRDQEKWDKENILSDKVREWDNPYYGFPQMIRFAFNPNESSRRRLKELRNNGNTYALSALFKPKSIKKAGDGSHKQFVYESEILDLLEVIDGSKDDDELLGFLDYDKIKEGKMCRHIVCVLPYCASCDALETLIHNNSNKFRNLNDYEIINISGVDRPREFKTPSEIKRRIREYEAAGKKTFTLTVNRMLTGSTVEQWDTMLFLKDTASPQEYDQAIFRLQNQYIKTYVNARGQTIKYNMKPQTLLVDFDPNRVFIMQEQKAQIYNVNVDDAGNSKLSERIAEELHMSPVIVLNKDKIEQVQATDVLKAVSEYSRSRGVAEEAQDIPVDMSLMGFKAIREAIEQENELGSKAGLTINGTEGEGQNIDTPQPSEEGRNPETPITEPSKELGTSDASTPANGTKNPAKQFRSYYARILFFAFLTKDVVISLSDIIACINETNNMRIAYNIGIKRLTLESIQIHADKFMLRALDYKIQNLNQLSHDNSLEGVNRAAVAIQKFGKLGESEVITPRNICNNMVGLIPEDGLKTILINRHKILDIAGKAGEFTLALCDRYGKMGYTNESLRNVIYTIPTSGLTYEFTRMIYGILGLDTNCIATKFTSYNLLNIKKSGMQEIDYDKIRLLLSQNKPFSEIKMTDEVTEGDEKVKFDVVVGNPPYQEGDGGAQKSARPIYQHFIECSKNLSTKYMTAIIPSRWYAGGKGLDEFRHEMLNDIHIQELDDFIHPEEVFPDTNNRGGVCYFLRNTDYDNMSLKVNVISHEGEGRISKAIRDIKTRNLDIFVRSSQAITILDKVIPDTTVETMTEHISPRKPFGIDGNFIKTDGFHKSAKKLSNPLKCYGKAKSVGYIEKSLIHSHIEWIDEWKVFLPYANNIGTELNDDNQNTFVAKPGSVCTETFLVAGADLNLNKATAYHLAGYLKTRFARFLLSLAKISQHGTSKTYRFVPVQDFSRPWSDANLYAKYGLTEEEIAYIESTIKPMT